MGRDGLNESQEESPRKWTLQSKLLNFSDHAAGDFDSMEQKEGESIKMASEELSRQFKTLIDADDMNSLSQLQLLILGRLQDSQAVLSHFNEYSEHCYAEVSGDFAKHTRLLRSMKSELDYIFQKIRTMKSRISATYPDAFGNDSRREQLDQRPDLEMPPQ